MPKVRIRYSSSSNISFRGVIETHMEREDFDEMTPSEQDLFVVEELNNLVDIYVEDES